MRKDEMKISDTFSKDHELISEFIALIGKFEFYCEVKNDCKKNDLLFLIDFFDNYVDKYHHIKEEKYIFPELMKNPISKAEGIIDIILNEHTIGRSYIEEIKELLLTSTNLQVNEITKKLKKLEYLLTIHIKKENAFISRFNEKENLDSVLNSINSLVADFENEYGMNDQEINYKTTIEKLSEKYALPNYG